MRAINALIWAAALYAPSTVLALWPMPRTLNTGSTYMKLASTFSIQINVNNPPQDLLDAVSQTTGFLQNDKLRRLAIGRGANDTSILAGAASLPKLTLSLLNGQIASSIAQESVRPLGQRSEGYSLTVPGDGSAATITANSTLGLFRGLTTFSQLWYDASGVTYTFMAPVVISNDSPAFPYRGFMLDTSRNFFPVDDIKRTLDAMSWVKINTLHWHIVDSQSFPLDVAEFPEIAQNGAYDASEVYTAADVQEIVAYAGARGIDVLMEIDTPGHTAIISKSHPEHIACAESSPWETFANEPPSGQLRLASSATRDFTANLLTAVAKTLPSTLFSTGGDEVNTNCYSQDPQTQTDLKNSGKTLEQALSDFVLNNHRALAAIGKTPVVWEEMVLDHNIAVSNNTVVMVWISSQHAASVASKNLHIVHAPSDYFYLDCGAGDWLGNNPTGNSWCDPFKTWQKAYTFDPLASLTTAQRALVLGGQQLLWTEQSSPENLDSIAWPRAASSAEVFWTGATLPDGKPRSVNSALPRLHDLRFRMVRRGVRAIALQPEWCAVRPGACNI
ncbi:glycoside hydrolase family 20 protein [Amanita thiersii Skay4041]|uniref:Beta-hexosaminidase n=1 Tax=Amanita thiersii Skay4041 TaxID=703135 RepID=A0A2A9NZG0_9AGAR|nr:glycoside hydrolase family 20 protein [Amanita thiersii Skay4041]